MAPKSKITIVSKQIPEFSSTVTVGETTFQAQTEDLGTKNHRISTRIYNQGEVVFTRESDYAHILKLDNFDTMLKSMMQNQHKNAVDTFVAEKTRKRRSKSEYFDEVKQFLRQGKGKQALSTLRDGLVQFPDDPFLMSYYGCLIAIIENNHAEGIRICENSIRMLENNMPFGSEFFYPLFYLNLGRAYLKGQRKKEAIEAFNSGLRHDPENPDIRGELKKLGSRRKAPLPFLPRSNPLNKYIGKLLSKSAN